MVKLPAKCEACGKERYDYGRCPCQQRDPEKLRDRCKAMVGAMQRSAMLRQGSPVDDLMAFVQSEIGRAADPSLEDTKPVILYFGSEQDREEFIAIVREVKPGMVSKPIP